MLDLKRKLDEIIAIYQFESELCDIYVEGITDKDIIDNYCEYKNLKRTVIEIDTIDLYETQSRFVDLNLRSNQDKLKALSRVLAENSLQSKIICIVDRDFDGVLTPLEENDFIHYTDYSCIESYLLCNKFIEKLIRPSILNIRIPAKTIISEIGKALNGLYILRMINKKFNFNFTLPRIESNLLINKSTGVCGFDFNNYLEKYINTNNLKVQKDNIQKFIDNTSSSLNRDIRFNMNGHDFTEILFLYINKIKNPTNFRQENFKDALFLALQPDYLDGYELFNKLSN